MWYAVTYVCVSRLSADLGTEQKLLIKKLCLKGVRPYEERTYKKVTQLRNTNKQKIPETGD